MKNAIVARFVLFCLLLQSAPRSAVAAEPSGTPSPVPRAAAGGRSEPARLDDLLALESVRARRLVTRELRFRLAELRQRDLERVRAVIERRLSIDALLAGEKETPAPAERTHGR